MDNPDSNAIIKFVEKHRRSIRLAEFDYTHPGAYFATLAVWNHLALFGEVVQEQMRLNRFGLIAQGELQRLPLRFPSIQIDEYVIMPNHVHFILWIIADASTSVGARRASVTASSNQPLASPIPARGARLQDMGSNTKSDSPRPYTARPLGRWEPILARIKPLLLD